jgi:glycosyltransferase involved in cell wall biosynthesis
MLRSDESIRRHLVCAIITPNYLDQFLVLGRSLAIAMPSADLRVLVLQDCADVGLIQQSIDDYLGATGSGADHQALTIDQCDWGDFDIASAALFYNILEFATSVKPALLRFFLGQGWERVTYLDPDIQVFEDFTPLLDDAVDVSLTPHFFTDIPRDGFRPSTNDVLMAGFYNLGFCSVRPTATSFLEWWSDRLQFDCLIDHTGGYFTDQKIIDLAPLKANVQVVKEPGCNVAYWNLHERQIVKDQGDWKITFDGSIHQLYFFHFSGFLLDRTPSLSKHATRKVLGDAIPRSFARQYEKQLLEAGPDEPITFTLGGTSLATPIPTKWNRCIREDAEVHIRAGFTLRQVREEIYPPHEPLKWSECLTCGVEHGNFGTRAQSFLAGWARHSSLEGVPNAISAFFRIPHHQFRAPAIEQLSWAADQLQEVVHGIDALVADVMAAAAHSIQDAVDLKLVGYFTYPAGVGQIARWTLRALEEAGIHSAIDRVFVTSDSDEYLSSLLARENPLAAANASALCFINADQWEVHVMAPQRVNPQTEHVEAVWAWELEQIPSKMYDIAASGTVQRVHALSRWSAQAMAKVLPVPVQRFAPFDMSLIEVLKGRSLSPTAPGQLAHYILTTFDAKSYLSRKNPEGALSLWQRVQADFPDHSLVIKSTDLRDLATPELLERIDASPRTVLIDELLTDDDYMDLLGHCDAFVSLHRSEGMGLTPIEAGLCGLPVIYTNYGGVSEFMDEGFFPVSYELVQVGESEHDSGPYDAYAWWAEPDPDDAERQLRRALEVSANGHAGSPLTVDRKRLEENLVIAQLEVVATAERLIQMAEQSDGPVEVHLIERLLAPLSAIVDPVEPANPNPVVFALVSVVYQGYRLLPARLRYQFNMAFNKLRSTQSGAEPEDSKEPPTRNAR